MRAEAFYPYKFRGEAMTLALKPSVDVPRASDGALLMFDTDEQDVTLEIELTIDAGVIEEVIPSSDRRAPGVEVYVFVRSLSSRKRYGITLSGSPRRTGTLNLRRADHVGEVSLQAYLVRTREIANAMGYGTRKGAILSTSDERRVLFDEPAAPPGNHILVRWIDFSSSPAYSKYKDSLFAVGREGDQPALFLNETFPDARRVLDSTGKRTHLARTRDGVFAAIAHQAWTVLLNEVTSRVRVIAEANEDFDAADVLDELDDWQKRALHDWAPHLMPGIDRASLDSSIVELCRGDDLASTLTRVLPLALQDRLKTGALMLAPSKGQA